MLKKLMKHEYKATGRFFLPAYAIFAALLVVERLSMLAAERLAKESGFLGQAAAVFMVLCTIATVLGVIAMMIAPVVFAISRFYRNMLGDEGYLSFTLPVTTSQHICSKLLVAGSWVILTVLAMLLYGFLFALSMDAAETLRILGQVGEFFSAGWASVGGWIILLLVLMLIAVLSQLCANLLALYSAMSMGQTVNKHKLLASAGIFIGFNFATSLLVQILAVVAVMLFGESGLETGIVVSVTSNTARAYCPLIVYVLLGAIVINVLLGVLHFFLSRHFLTKRLNLA